MGWKTGLCVVAGLVLALSATPAAAMCIDNCASICAGSSTAESCRDNCESNHQQCLKQQQRTSYGAVAYGPSSHAWGTAYKWGSRAKAESTAIKNCGATDCKAVVWFNRRCGAVAADTATGDYGYDSGTSKNAAEASALRYCTSEGGKACKVVAWACSF